MSSSLGRKIQAVIDRMRGKVRQVDPADAWGASQRDARKLVQPTGALEAIFYAHKGRIAGRPVELIRRDAPGSAPDLARRLAQELVVRDRVELLTGLDFSPNAYAVGAIAAQAKVPAIVMNAASSGIPARSPFVVRVSFTVAQVTAPLAQWALREGVREVCTLVADYAPGVDAESAFGKPFVAGGGRIAAALRVPMGTDGGALFMNPQIVARHNIVPQGIAKTIHDR